MFIKQTPFGVCFLRCELMAVPYKKCAILTKTPYKKCNLAAKSPYKKRKDWLKSRYRKCKLKLERGDKSETVSYG